jgi:hypothetical protein
MKYRKTVTLLLLLPLALFLCVYVHAIFAQSFGRKTALKLLHCKNRYEVENQLIGWQIKKVKSISPRVEVTYSYLGVNMSVKYTPQGEVNWIQGDGWGD